MRRSSVLVCLAVLVVGAAAAQEIDLTGFQGRIPQAARDLKGVDLVTEGRPARASGGPDAFGYVYMDSAEPGGPTFQWVEIAGTGTSVPQLSDDDSEGPLAIGFTFPFYGADQTQFYVSSNGHMTFGTGSTDYSNDCPIPNTAIPNNMIALMWDDMNPSTNSDPVWYASYAAGSCPWGGYAGACLVVEYEGFTHYSGVNGDAGTWEAILFDNGDIVLQFLDSGSENGSGSTTGIESADGTVGLNYGCDTVGSLSDNLAIRFYVSSDVADLVMTKAANADPVLPGGTLTYTLGVSNAGPLPATGVVVTDALPTAQATYLSNTCGATVSGSDLTWAVGSLANGASASCTVSLRVDACAPITNSATVDCNEIDPPGNNTATVTINANFNAVQGGDFEDGTPNPYWAEASTNFGTPLCDEAGCGTGGGTAGPHTGLWWAWFGGATAYEDGSVTQSVTIDANSLATLEFWVWTPTPSGAGTGTLTASIDGTSVFTTAGGNPAYSAGYVQVSVDVSAFADGGSHTLMFQGIQDTGETVNMHVDDVSLAVCPQQVDADLGIVKVANVTGTVNIGDPVVFTLTVTNYGPSNATNVVVTDPLPAGVAYVSNSCGATNVPPWTWTIPTLAAGASVSCDITVTATGGGVVNTASVASDQTDPVATNNSGSAGFSARAPGIPSLGLWGMALLALLMAAVAVPLLRRVG